MTHISHRIGSTPRQRGSMSGQTCPDVFELTDGDYAVIGAEATDELKDKLPAGVVLQPGERIVIVPAVLLTDAKPHVPDA